jgi:hypothetical protein
MTLLIVAIVLTTTASLTAAFTLAVMVRSYRLRRAHEIPNPVFFRTGSGLVFGTLAAGLLLGLCIMFFYFQ